MSDVRPLAFLLCRSVVNGVKRAATSPKRLIGLAFFLFYYWNLFLRPFSPSHATHLPVEGPRFTMWPLATIDAVVFGVVGALSLFLMGSVLSYRGGFKAADVDVLFPTPVSPRVVLLFRIARDTLASLLIPLFVGVFGYRGGSQAFREIFRNYPERGGDILRACGLAYLLVAVAWVCIGYAASLFVNRSDLDSDRYRKRINGVLVGLFFALALFVAIKIRQDNLTLDTYVEIAQAPLVRIILAPVTLATWFVMGLFEGKLALAAAGLGGLALVVGGSLRIALTQVGWMYDQAAVRGFDSGPNLRELQRRGDMMGIQAERARQGKIRQGRIARRVASLRVRGPLTLLWKEAILQARGSLSGLVAIALFFVVGTGMLMWAMQHAETNPRSKLPVPGWTIMGMQAMIVYTLCMASANGGFIELLRRVDLQKPLPFTPAVTVFWETAAKAVAPTLLGLLCAVVGTVINPSVWPHALAGSLMAPSLAVLLSAVVLLVILLFPDIEDPTQRMFRGLMMLLGIAIALALGAAVLAGGIWAGVSPLILAPVVFAINLGISAGLSVVSGALYANFNPSE